MQRKVQLMASVIKSLGAAFRKLAAGLVAEGRITAPRGVETLVELAEASQLPTPAALAADFDDRQSFDEEDDCPGMESGDHSDEEEIPLDEMPEDMAMVEAGALRPNSLMQVELTGRVDLRAEDLKLDNPAPGTSVTDKMLHLLQATSCGQRQDDEGRPASLSALPAW
ncbi:hypothetical protein CYMTET_54206 [Cymbomonas tetramitiformis]|uniref:Uncharacterized protein n=1 Tax=Cymbomonas tetramitiformis TaxID=36881 RepID=A0AAE0EPK7_9CHLO|nr:hypothetical protein CYMTET_54206 [Cymbomonas tetramitiformis]